MFSHMVLTNNSRTPENTVNVKTQSEGNHLWMNKYGANKNKNKQKIIPE